MSRPPRTLGIYLCKRIAVDASLGEMSLVGVFAGMSFDRFPSPIQRFTICAVLYNGVGEGTMEVRITQMETEKDIYRHQRWRKLPGPGMQSQLEVRVSGCVFPAPGRYFVTVQFDQEEVDSRILEVFSI